MKYKFKHGDGLPSGIECSLQQRAEIIKLLKDNGYSCIVNSNEYMPIMFNGNSWSICTNEDIKNKLDYQNMKSILSTLVEYKIGDKVVKNETNWIPNDFDNWGRGIGIGEIVEPPFELFNHELDVRWPNGRCFETIDQIKKYES